MRPTRKVYRSLTRYRSDFLDDGRKLRQHRCMERGGNCQIAAMKILRRSESVSRKNMRASDSGPRKSGQDGKSSYAAQVRRFAEEDGRPLRNQIFGSASSSIAGRHLPAESAYRPYLVYAEGQLCRGSAQTRINSSAARLALQARRFRTRGTPV